MMDNSTSKFATVIEVALAPVLDAYSNLSRFQKDVIFDVLLSFLQQKCNVQEAAQVVVPVLGTDAPLAKLIEIINTPSTPLPFVRDAYSINGKCFRVKMRKWDPYEDRRLIAGIYRFGLADWNSIATFVGSGRTKTQCAQRWQRGLNPNIKKAPWTQAEDQALFSLVAVFGTKNWIRVAENLEERSDVQCRYRYYQLLKSSIMKANGQAAQQIKNINVNVNDITSAICQSQQAPAPIQPQEQHPPEKTDSIQLEQQTQAVVQPAESIMNQQGNNFSPQISSSPVVPEKQHDDDDDKDPLSPLPLSPMALSPQMFSPLSPLSPMPSPMNMLGESGNGSGQSSLFHAYIK